MVDLLEGAPLFDLDSDAVEAACQKVRNYCHWHIAPSIVETVTVRLWEGVGWLPSRYVTAVSSITVDGIAPLTSTWSPKGRLELPDYRYAHHHRRGRSAVVTLTHGYTVCPSDVRQVVARLAKAGLRTDPLRSAQIATVRLDYVDVSRALADLDAYVVPVVS